MIKGSLPDSAPCGYFTFNANGELLSVNNLFVQIAGEAGKNMIGQHIEKYLTLPSKIFYQTHFFPLLNMQGHAEEIFLTLLSANKEIIPVLLNAVKQNIENVDIYACAFIVVKHRKKFENELVAARKEAQRALQENSELQNLRDQLLLQKTTLDEQLIKLNQQNEDLKQFTRVVTHELQEPLRKVSMFADMITGHNKESKPSEDTLERLSRSSAQMRTVISGLQQYLWLQEAPPRIEQINLAALLRHTALNLEAEQGKDLLEVEMENLQLFKADPHQWSVLCYQLLSNSIKFRKPGEIAHVRINTTEIKKNKFQESTDHYAYVPYLKIDFIDNGKGFDPVYQEQVFQLFERLEQTDGRGMGLALCKRVVANHNGTISIDTLPGRGTTVSILIPI